jgi:hypothetical protein
LRIIRRRTFMCSDVTARRIRIDTLDVIASSGRIDLREALAWAEGNRDFLLEQWSRLSGDEQ